jgi:chemotaxis protein MotB
MVRPLIAGLGGVLAIAISGCVGQTSYQKKVEEASVLTRDLSELQRKNLELAHENEGLRTEIGGLRTKLDEIVEGRKRLEQMLSKKPDKVYQRMAELEREKVGLKEDLANLEKVRGEKVSDARMLYETLLEVMKEDIAAGRVNVAELHGLITVSPVDAALFEPDSGVITSSGMHLLRKITDFLKSARGSEVQVSAGFDLPAESKTPDGSQSSWILPMTRIGAVTGVLRMNGVDPAALKVVVIGGFLSGNLKSGARRIEISIKAKE